MSEPGKRSPGSSKKTSGSTRRKGHPWPTSGSPAIDDLIEGVRVGDNLVFVTSGDMPTSWLTDHFAKAADPDRLVVVGTSGALDASGAAITLDWSKRGRRRVPAASTARSQLADADSQVGEGSAFVFECLSTLADSWGADAALDLFLSTCPRLYRRGSIAMWIVDGDRHDRSFMTRLSDVTQVVVGMTRLGEGDDDVIQLEVMKADGRPRGVLGRRVVARLVAGSLQDARSVAPDRRRLAETVKSMRASRGVGQAELARRVGVTPSALSQVERGVRGVSAETLIAICDALGIPFAPDDPLHRGYRVERRAAQREEKVTGGVRGRRLVDHPVASVWKLTVDPRASGRQQMFTSKGLEVVLVTGGVLDLDLAGHSETLQDGDSLVVDTAVIDGWGNPSDAVTEVLWFVSGR